MASVPESGGGATVNITIPVYNEELRLPGCILTLARELPQQCRLPFEVVIAENGSTDETPALADYFGACFGWVRVLHIKEKGRGGAIRRAWANSAAEINVYMDVDLATDLSALPALIHSVHGERCDLAIGSRFHKGSKTVRCLKREVTSRFYNFLLQALLHTHILDAQCGFKAISARATRELLPLVEDNGWFFDSEMLVLAENLGYRVHEVPVTWTENTDSRVDLPRTILTDLSGLWRLRRERARLRLGEKRGVRVAVGKGTQRSFFTRNAATS